MDRRRFLSSSLVLPATLFLPESLRAVETVPRRRALDLRLVEAVLEHPAAEACRARGRVFLDLGADNVARFRVQFPSDGYYHFELRYGGDTLPRPPRAAVLLDRRLLGTNYFLTDHEADPTAMRPQFSHGDLGTHRVTAGLHTVEIETLFERGEALESLRVTPTNRPLDRPRLSFVQLSDTHIMKGQYPVWLNRKIDGDMPEALLEVAAKIRELSPDFVMHTGDIVDGETPESIAFAREVMRPIPRPLYPILGNHDTYRNNHANWLSIWKDDFPSDKVYYSFDCKGWHFIMLDCLLNQSHSLREPQLAWLDADLAQHPDRPTVIAAHTPVGEPGENPRLTSGLAPRLAVNPQVKLILAGHTHRNHYARYNGRAHATVAAMVEWPLIYRRFLVFSDRVEVETYQLSRPFQRNSWMSIEDKLDYRRKHNERPMEKDHKNNNDMLGDNATLSPVIPLSA
ncbi:metallophosphoesterase [bacterium]|nr:metallophosphoesterase [bacterium]